MEVVGTKKSASSKAKRNISSEKVDFSMQSDKLALLKILLQKSDLTMQDIIKTAATRFINSNLDLLTEEEQREYKSLIFKGNPRGNG